MAPHVIVFILSGQFVLLASFLIVLNQAFTVTRLAVEPDRVHRVVHKHVFAFLHVI